MTAPRFLIDENLSPHLVSPAHDRGYEAAHVNHLGLRCETDWDLLKIIAAEDWTLVTNNAIEFRGVIARSNFIRVSYSCCRLRGALTNSGFSPQPFITLQTSPT